MRLLRRRPARSAFPLGLPLAVLPLLGACYGKPSLPGSGEEGGGPAPGTTPAAASEVLGIKGESNASGEPGRAPRPPPVRAPQPGDDDPSAQARRMAELAPVLARLGHARETLPAAGRPGAGDFRPAELDKAREILETSCAASGPACAETARAIAALALPSDEAIPLYARFLGPIRPQAELGAALLGAPLLLHPNPEVRDRAFRIAVGSGAAARGEPDRLGRRAATIPRRPKPGEPTVVVLERVQTCAALDGDWKGPDAAGRVDVHLRGTCPDETLDPDAGPIAPGLRDEDLPFQMKDEPLQTVRAARGVWAFRVDAFPQSGLAIFCDGEAAERPLLQVPPPFSGPEKSPGDGAAAPESRAKSGR